MSQHGACLQTYNQDLVKCLEELKNKRNDLAEIIQGEEHEKTILEERISNLNRQLSALNKNLTGHKQIFENYSRTIEESENGFKKIVESSQTLLNLLKHQANTLENQYCTTLKKPSKTTSHNYLLE